MGSKEANLIVSSRAYGFLKASLVCRRDLRICNHCISARLNLRPACLPFTHSTNKERVMQTDLHHFLTSLARTVAMTLVPVALIAFLTMPASLHHHIGKPANVTQLAPQHMT
jgi:hypothetical protein